MKKMMVFSLLAFLILVHLAKADITTDKDIYKPGDTVIIQLSSTKNLTDVKFDIMNPKGIIETSQTSMTYKSQGLWEYNYTIGTGDLNGTYLINITASEGGTLVDVNSPIFLFTKNFDVLAWKVDASLNKYHFVPKETLNLNLLITNKYSDSLTFDVFYFIQDPAGNSVRNESFKLNEVNQGFLDTYAIPEDYNYGTSTINISLTDYNGRYASVILKFSVSQSMISITPDTINDTTREVVEKVIDLQNLGDSDISITGINVTEELSGAVSILERPYTLYPNSTSSMKIRIDPSNLSQGSYSGTINVLSDAGSTPIYINLEVLSVTSESVPDYSFIIWAFAIFTVVVIIFITFLRHEKIKKKKAEEKKKADEKRKKEDTYYKPPQEEYRTEYY